MDIPENYYALLGVSSDADSDTIKRAYRQLARRYHPDLAGPDPEAAIRMKRINRAYAVLSDDEKRHQYDIILGGVVDLRQNNGNQRPGQRTHPRANPDEVEFAGLRIFSTRGPFQAGPAAMTVNGITSAIHSIPTAYGALIATGSLDGKGSIWQLQGDRLTKSVDFVNDSGITLEALRELRLSNAGTQIAGWNRIGFHVWDAIHGQRIWSTPLMERAVSAHYSLDATFSKATNERPEVQLALPHLPKNAKDIPSPRAWGVRSTDVLSHILAGADHTFGDLRVCRDEEIENRNFWAIRMRALSQDATTLVTLSCAQIQGESQQMAVIRRWNLSAKGLFGMLKGPQIAATILLGRCEDCMPPYASTADASLIAFFSAQNKVRLADTTTGTYSEVASGAMGSSSRMALSPDGEWLAIAREDSEANEGVIDLWSVATGQLVQKFYHPWQVSALHFGDHLLLTALTDSTLQVWQQKR